MTGSHLADNCIEMMVIVHPLSDPDICAEVHLRALRGGQSDPAGFFGCLMLISSCDLAQFYFRHCEFVEAPDDKLGHLPYSKP